MSTHAAKATEYNPLILGWGNICLNVADINASLDFYNKLGCTMVGGNPAEGWVVVNNAITGIGLFQGHITEPMINFRGYDIQKLATEMKRRGFTLESEATFNAADWPPEWSQDAQGNSLPDEGSPSFTIKDPAGVAVFFDTVPGERARYQQGQTFGDEKITGELLEGQQ